MAGNTTEVMVGGAVLVIAAGFFVYAARTTGVSGNDDAYDLRASFRSAEGVAVGTDVRLAGVKVGTVTALDLNPQTFRADAVFAIDEDIELPDDSSVVVASEGLLGGNFIELIPGGSPFTLGEGAEIEDTQSAVSLISLLLKFVSGRSADE